MQQKNIAKKQASLKLITILLACFCVLCLLGSTLAWFTHQNTLNGSGSTPNAESHLFVDGTEVATPVVNQVVSQTGNISKNVQFSCQNSNIDVLAVATISINFSDGSPLEDNDWVSLNISNSSWTKGSEENVNRYYYNSKIEKANASNKITVFDTISVNNDFAVGKTLQITVYVQVVQANSTGLAKLTQAGYNLPSGFSSLV